MTTPLVRPDIPSTYFAPKDQDVEIAYRKSLAALLANYPESPLTPGLPPGFGPNINSPFAQFQTQFNNSTSNQLELPHLQNLQISPGNLNRFQSTNNPNTKNFLPPNSIPSSRLSVSPRTSSANTSGYHSFSSSTNSLEQLYAPYQQSAQSNTSGMSHFSPEHQTFMSGNMPHRLNNSGGSQSYENECRTPTPGYTPMLVC